MVAGPTSPTTASLTPRRRALELATLVGLAASALLLALPPHGLWPLAFVGTAALYALLTNERGMVAVGCAWLVGFAVNLAGNGWALDVMHRFAGVSTSVGLLALALTAAYQASVFALAALLVMWLRRRRVSPLLAAPLGVALAEAVLPFVFPWYLGVAVAPAWPLLQVSELGGPPAVTALLVLSGGVAAQALGALHRRQRPAPSLLGATAVIAALLAVGAGRAWQVARARAHAPALRVAIVQPNFGTMPLQQRELDGAALLQTLRSATETAGDKGAELVVWPESSFPFLFDRAQPRLYPPGHPWDLRGRYRGRILFGALTHLFGEAHVYNSAVLAGADGTLLGIYDKVRLVPFGEYVPLRDRFPTWAARMRERMPSWPEIQHGAGPRVLVDDTLRVSALVCYEDLLPDQVAAMARDGAPTLLVTVANHAWFGGSAAPHQALALATLRAVETRRDLVRSANTGISAVVDALGRLQQRGALRDVDPAQPPPPELLLEDVRLLEVFALGPWAVPTFPWICALILGIAAWRGRRRDLGNSRA